MRCNQCGAEHAYADRTKPAPEEYVQAMADAMQGQCGYGGMTDEDAKKLAIIAWRAAMEMVHEMDGVYPEEAPTIEHGADYGDGYGG